MNKNKKLKVEKINCFINLFNSSKSLYMFDYSNISATFLNEIKMNNEEKGLKIAIFKNRLAKIALNELNFSKEKIDSALKGPTAFAFSKTNELVPGKIISSISKTIPSVKLKMCIIDNKILELNDAINLCKYESKKELYGFLALLLSFPINKFLITLKAVCEKKINNDQGKDG